MIGIYAIQNTKNNKQYIGSAYNINRRWTTHKRNLNQNKHENEHLQRAWNKNGLNAFNFVILEELDNDKTLEKIEQKWINKLNPKYNICQFVGRPPLRKGFSLTKEHKRKIGIANKGKLVGRKLSMVTRKRMSQALKGHPGWTNGLPAWNKGIPMTQGQKKKISLALKGRLSPMKGKSGYWKGKKNLLQSERMKKIWLARKGGLL